VQSHGVRSGRRDMRRIRRIAGWKNKREADWRMGEVGLGVRGRDLKVLVLFGCIDRHGLHLSISYHYNYDKMRHCIYISQYMS
jgi:hypothetical protein